jgi:peptidoglycan/xylan/chitin deacetylase (PgdA/CDA1 family)/SAM-dependent methyltransferase
MNANFKSADVTSGRESLVLMYHRVDRDAADPFRIRTSPENFTAHIDYLKKNYDIVTLAKLHERLRSGGSAEGLASVTFDDGYESVFSVAGPILQKFGFPACVFMTCDFLHGRAFWWERLSKALGHGSAAGAQTDEKGAASAFTAQWDRLRRLPAGERDAMLAELGELHQPASPTTQPLRDWQVLDLANGLFEIGCHTKAHPLLTSLAPDAAADEINGSKAELEFFLGRKIDHFSYPFGESNEAVRRLVAEAGFACAFRVGQQFVRPSDDPFALPRIDVGNRSMDELEKLLKKIRDKNAAESTRGKPDGAVTSAPAAPDLKAKAAKATPEKAKKEKGERQPINLGDWARLTPVSKNFGFDRGSPMDRGPIETFLLRHSGDIAGRILEVKDPAYARRFSKPGSQIDVLDIDASNPKADIIASIETGEGIADDTYDCIILTQVLQYVFDLKSAVRTLSRILKPGGVLLLSVCGITRARKKDGPWYWSLHAPAVRRLLEEDFDERKVLVESHGNLLRAAAFLYGLAEDELPAELRSKEDEEFTIVVTARAVKAAVPVIPRKLSLPALRKRPKVSVIIPLYNAARTIGETIESVLVQSMPDWEAIIVDDGSSDASRERAGAYARIFKDRIFILQHPDGKNHGLSATRNLALERARGEFVAFLDADDIWMPGKLEYDTDILRKHPQAVGVVGPALWWWDDGSGTRPFVDKMLAADRVYEPPTFCIDTFVKRKAGPPGPVTWTFRKRGVDTLSPPFDPYVLTYEDQKFLAEISWRHPIYVSGRCLSEYRRTDQSLWQAAERSGTGAIARQRFEDWLQTLTGQRPQDGSVQS